MKSLNKSFTHYNWRGKEIVRLPRNSNARQINIYELQPKDLRTVLEHRLVEMMGMAGFSYKAIMKTLGLNKNEVQQRLRRVEVRIRDYRDGRSELAQQIITRLENVAQRRLVENLAPLLLK